MLTFDLYYDLERVFEVVLSFVENDSTITMVNAELKLSPNPDFNYSLTLQ